MRTPRGPTITRSVFVGFFAGARRRSFPGFLRPLEARRKNAARKSNREGKGGPVGFVATPRAYEGPHAQRLALLGEAPVGEPSSVLGDQDQSARKIAARVRRVSSLKQLELSGERVRVFVATHARRASRLGRHGRPGGDRGRCGRWGNEPLVASHRRRARALWQRHLRRVSGPTAKRGERADRADRDRQRCQRHTNHNATSGN
jgi:hypothetical protein